MTGPGEALLLVLAGVGGGLAGSIAGLASLVSYPALLAAGLPPVTANVTNTVALVFSSVGSVSGSRPELRGRRAELTPWGVLAAVAGAAGAALLLLTPPGVFAAVVPVLIGGASLVIVFRPRTSDVPRGRGHRAAATAVVGAACLYAGYFGAAAGVVLLAVLLRTTGEPLARANAAKNLLLGLANLVAAVGFAVLGPVSWAHAVPLALGFLVGGRVGPAVVRRAPQDRLRVGIGLAGVVVAVVLAVRTYA